MKIYRQGDVLLVGIQSLPVGNIVPLDNGRIVLAYGEVTGCSHAITVDKTIPQAKLWSADAERYLQVMETVALHHEEHATVVLDPGIYRIAIQTEYTPQELRNVQD